MDVVGASLVGGKGNLIAGHTPGGFLTAPDGIAIAVRDSGGQGGALADGQRVAAADIHGCGVSRHRNHQLRGREGAVDFNPGLDGVAARIVTGKGEAAAVLLHLAVDGPLDVCSVIALAAQLDRGVDGQFLALLDGGVRLIQRQLHAGIVEHSLDGDILCDVVIAGRRGDAVAPFVEHEALRCHGRNVDAGAGGCLNLQAGDAGLAVAGQRALGRVLHLIAGGELFRGSCRLSRIPADGLGSTLRNIAGVGAAVHCVVSVALGVFQHNTCAGGTVAAALKVRAFRVAIAVFQRLGGVQVLDVQIAADRGQRLIELVNVGLNLGGIGAVLLHRGHRHGNDIAVRIGGPDAL